MATKKDSRGSRQAQPRRQVQRRGRRSLLRPKGRMNPYACFVRTCREELQKSQPGTEVTFAEFSKHCARRWKALSPGEKAHFEGLARADGRRFAREMRSYDPSMEGRADLQAPKRPMSAFLLFCQEYRPQLRAHHPDLSLVQVSQRLGAMWRGLSSEEYQRFAGLAAWLRDKYRRDVDKYKKKVKKITHARSQGREEEDDDEEDEEESLND